MCLFGGNPSCKDLRSTDHWYHPLKGRLYASTTTPVTSIATKSATTASQNIYIHKCMSRQCWIICHIEVGSCIWSTMVWGWLWSICVPQSEIHWNEQTVRSTMLIDVYFRFYTTILSRYTVYSYTDILRSVNIHFNYLRSAATPFTTTGTRVLRGSILFPVRNNGDGGCSIWWHLLICVCLQEIIFTNKMQNKTLKTKSQISKMQNYM